MTKVFVMTHKKFLPPAIDCYIPVQVGRAGKQDLGYIGDDTGDNISELNCYYGELTGVYWVWKNFPGNDNVGICHYRRFFMNQDKKMMTEEQYDEILSEYDIITSKAFPVEKDSYREGFAEAHDIEDLIMTGEVIKELYPEDYPAFEKMINGNDNYFGNLCVTSRDIFNQYCSWLFSIFDDLKDRIDFDKYEDDYHRRIFGFISEALLKVFVMARNLKVYECSVMVTGEKAETKEFKMALGQLVKMNQITEARQLFYEIMRVRPDVALENSDLKGEVFVIEQILYIIEEEQKAGFKGMLEYSNVLVKLIEHYGKLVDLLDDISNNKENVYFTETNTTPIAVEVIARNNPRLVGKWEEVLRGYNS
ncbi:MAG: DUF4422 domain-containing protein [Lachnospira sp.]